MTRKERLGVAAFVLIGFLTGFVMVESKSDVFPRGEITEQSNDDTEYIEE